MSLLNLHSRFLFAALGLAVLSACTHDPRPLEEQLQEALSERLRQFGVKGASAAVIFPDGTLWRGTSGFSHDKVLMRPDMSFGIGSITKNVVATLTLQLAEEGKLSLEDPLSRWLPPHPYIDGKITIRQLLNHSSGIFMFWENQKLWDDLIRYRNRIFTPEEVLDYLQEPHFPPGTGYRYSNTNYLLAAMIITRATGSTLAVELRKRFWEPLGLQSASLAIEEPYPETMAHVWSNYFEKNGDYRDVTALPRASHDSIGYGSAGVFMTAEDLARWTHALFHGRIINESSLAQMTAFDTADSHGLGLDRLGRGISGRVNAVGHGGGNIGTTSYMAFLPDHDVSIAVMINHFGGNCAARMVSDLARLTAQTVKPETLIERAWSLDGLLSGGWLLGGVGIVIFAIRRNRPLVLLLFGSLAMAAGWLSTRGNMPLNHLLIPEGAAAAAFGLAWFLSRFVRRASRS